MVRRREGREIENVLTQIELDSNAGILSLNPVLL